MPLKQKSLPNLERAIFFWVKNGNFWFHLAKRRRAFYGSFLHRQIFKKASKIFSLEIPCRQFTGKHFKFQIGFCLHLPISIYSIWKDEKKLKWKSFWFLWQIIIFRFIYVNFQTFSVFTSNIGQLQNIFSFHVKYWPFWNHYKIWNERKLSFF